MTNIQGETLTPLKEWKEPTMWEDIKDAEKIERTREEDKKLSIRFCGYCGKQMRTWFEPADKCFMFYGDTSSIPVASKYDKKTGKKNFVRYYMCQDYQKRKWHQTGESLHDNYFEEKVFNFE